MDVAGSNVFLALTLEPASYLAAILSERASEKASEGTFLRPDLEAVHVQHEAQHAQQCRRPARKIDQASKAVAKPRYIGLRV